MGCYRRFRPYCRLLFDLPLPSFFPGNYARFFFPATCSLRDFPTAGFLIATFESAAFFFTVVAVFAVGGFFRDVGAAFVAVFFFATPLTVAGTTLAAFFLAVFGAAIRALAAGFPADAGADFVNASNSSWAATMCFANSRRSGTASLHAINP